jgi:rhodanese-related sulfurtransferase
MPSRTWALVTALSLSVAACSKPQPPPSAEEREGSAHEAFGRLTVDELVAKMKAAKEGKLKLAVFDNNERERFVAGHIPGATWVKFDAVQARDLPADKATTLVFYCTNQYCTACHSGASSAVKLGYTNVFILPTGIRGWEKAKQPVEKS